MDLTHDRYLAVLKPRKMDQLRLPQLATIWGNFPTALPLPRRAMTASSVAVQEPLAEAPVAGVSLPPRGGATSAAGSSAPARRAARRDTSTSCVTSVAAMPGRRPRRRESVARAARGPEGAPAYKLVPVA
eukprot:CAMPEP_0204524394 /NCGR_PEP_ID=MMETSP0661-20131031/7354_1 /ASSEMBLY_ACC=CAM_ASM_000606 /TAXON_ID=109239 /ORGANISM="Alexandrium margalefi, Strain AMGDE01CS-322" /LENGTH=129 /DNA_ID=CAMNT_0051530149 /DNA_START=475 /DNA_END=860 /DNA_ORIENTATION=+